MLGTQTTQNDLQITYLILTLLSEFSKTADAKPIYKNQLHLYGIKYRTKLLKIFLVGLNLIIHSFNLFTCVTLIKKNENKSTKLSH